MARIQKNMQSNWARNIRTAALIAFCVAVLAVAPSSDGQNICAQFTGATADIQIRNCIAALPTTGGVADARSLQGAQSFASTLVIAKPITLLLGAAQITGPSTGPVISVQAQGVIIQGVSSVQGLSLGTVIIAQTNAQSDGIYFSATGRGNVNYRVRDLSILDSTQGGSTRTSGIGFHVDANAAPAQNSIGEAENLFISYFYNNMFISRPQTTRLSRITSYTSKQDGIVIQGDGTNVRLETCFSNYSGRYNFAQHGMTNVTYANSPSNNSVSDGYHIDRQDGTSGTQAIAVHMDSPDSEFDAQSSGAGIYCFECVGLEISVPKVLRPIGNGIWIDGGRGVITKGGQVAGAGGIGLKVTTSATPTIPDAVINIGTQLTGNAGGNEGGDAFAAAVTTLSYDGSPYLRFAYPLALIEQMPPSGVANQGIIWADGGDHFEKYNPNNSGEQHVPQMIMLAAAYTNATTNFTTVSDGESTFSFSVNKNTKYSASCHLYYQVASTFGGLNIQFVGPASPTAVTYSLNDPLSTATFSNSVATNFSLSLGAPATTAARNADAIVDLGLVNGTTAGIVTLQARSAAAVTLTIQPGSFCVFE